MAPVKVMRGGDSRGVRPLRVAEGAAEFTDTV
jgi:hypothetical protein